MTSASLSINRLVNVSVNLSPAAAKSQDLAAHLILGPSTVIDTAERMRSYSSITKVATDFGINAPEYLAAALWFQQSPQPSSVLIGRWAKDDTNATLTGDPRSAADQAIAGWNSITDGAFRMRLDGTLRTISGLNFSAAANMNAVAAIVQTALAAIVVGSTCVWDAAHARFVLKSGTAGAASEISLMTSPVTGTDVSGMLGGAAGDAYAVQGVNAEEPVEAVVVFDSNFGQSFYSVQILGGTDDQLVDVSAYVEASTTKHLHGVTTQTASTLSTQSTSNLAARMKAAGYKRTAVAYSSTSPYAIASLLARILTTDYNANNSVITLMFKQAPGIVAENVTTAQADALKLHNCNAYVAYNNDTAIIQNGVVSSGEFLDTVIGTDALAVGLQTALYNTLYTGPTKIPQTDGGNNELASVMEGECQRFVDNGLLAPGSWTSQGFGALKSGGYLSKGFYIYVPPAALQSTEDRAARKSVKFQIAAKLAGAIHSVDVLIDVNR